MRWKDHSLEEYGITEDEIDNYRAQYLNVIDEITVPVAYGYGAAQEEAVELDVHELARTLFLAAAGQLHLIDLRQRVNRPV